MHIKHKNAKFKHTKHQIQAHKHKKALNFRNIINTPNSNTKTLNFKNTKQ